jgi:hypothetical protein
MKNILCSVFVLSFLTSLYGSAHAQSLNVPSVIALYPNSIEMDSLAATELKGYENEKAVTDEFRKGFLREGLAPNWKTIRQKELEFMEKQDFFSILVLAVTRELTYKEVENRSNLLIYPTKEKSISSLTAYKKIADQNKMSWVVNFIKAEAHMLNGKRSLVVSVQLYNVVQPRLFLDKKFIIDSTLLQEAEACEEVWVCLSQQISNMVVIDLMDKIERFIRLSR